MGHTARQRRSDFLFASLRLLSKKGPTRERIEKHGWEPRQQRTLPAQQDDFKKLRKEADDLRGLWRTSMLEKLALEDRLAQEQARKGCAEEADADAVRRLKDQLAEAHIMANGEDSHET